MTRDKLIYIPFEWATVLSCHYQRYWYKYFEQLWDEIMSLALLYIISPIPIEYGILYINIIIFKTFIQNTICWT